MLRASVLVVALLVNAPVLWTAFGSQTTSVDNALIRLLITVPVVAILLGALRYAATRRDPARVPVRPEDPR